MEPRAGTRRPSTPSTRSGLLQAESNWPAAVDALLRAWSMRPTRAEPLYHLAFGYRNRAAWSAAYLFATRGVYIVEPDDILYVESLAVSLGAAVRALRRRVVRRRQGPGPFRHRGAARRSGAPRALAGARPGQSQAGIEETPLPGTDVEVANESKPADPEVSDHEAAGGGHGDRLLAWSLRRGSVLCAVFVIVVGIAKYGVGIYPSWNFMVSFAQHWRTPEVSPLLQGPNNFRLASPITAVVAGVLNITNGPAYLGIHLPSGLWRHCDAVLPPLRPPHRRTAADGRTSPGRRGGPAVLLDWVGSYDAVTIAAGAVIGLAESPVVVRGGMGGPGVQQLGPSRHRSRHRCPHSLQRETAGVLSSDRDLLYRHGRRLRRVFASSLNGWGGATSQLTLIKFYGMSRFVTSAVHYWPLDHRVRSGRGLGLSLEQGDPSLSGSQGHVRSRRRRFLHRAVHRA